MQAWRSGALAVPSTKISAAEIDRDGSDLNLIAAACSVMGDAIVARAALAYSGVFEATAKGQRLDRVIFDRKGLARVAAAPGLVTLTLERPTFAAGAGNIQGGLRGSTPQPTRVRVGSGASYFLKASVPFGATDLGPFTVVAEAELAGDAYAVDADQTWQFVDAVFDASIVVTNVEKSAGSAEEQTDAQYLALAREFFPTLRRATQRAILNGLLSTPGVASASVNEVLFPDGEAARAVEAFVLDDINRSNAALVARAQLTQLEYRALGIPVFLGGGVPDYVDIEFTDVEFDASIVSDTGACFEQVRTRVVAALNNQLPGQKLLRSTILAAARAVPGFLVEDTDLTEPLSTLVPGTTSTVFRTKPELVTLV